MARSDESAEVNGRPTFYEPRSEQIARFLLRLSLGAGLLSAVADRLGIWGSLGNPSVAWGTFSNFLSYTHQLCPWCPQVLLAPLGWSVTLAEALFGLLLILGVWLKPVAYCCSALTLVFAISMTAVLGIHAPLNYSVFVFSFAAALLGIVQQEPGLRPETRLGPRNAYEDLPITQRF